MIFSVEEIVSMLARRVACVDGKADIQFNIVEGENDIMLSLNEFLLISKPHYEEIIKPQLETSFLIKELSNQDPIIKLFTVYTCLEVAHVQNEDEELSIKSSQKEWDIISQIIGNFGISNFVRDSVRDLSIKLVKKILPPNLWRELPALENLKKEIRDGVIGFDFVIPMLTAFFDAVEKEGDLIYWEQNYIALKRNKRLLKKFFGEINIEHFDSIYEDLKFSIKEKKTEIRKSSNEKQKTINKLLFEEKKLKLRNEKEAIKKLEKEEKVQEKLKLKLIKEEAKKEAIRLKNEEHEFTVSRGISYCKYCGALQNDIVCRRDYGHKYTLKKVVGEYNSEYKPKCKRCGIERWCFNYRCT